MKRITLCLIVLGLIPIFGFANEKVELLTTEYQPFCGAKGDTMWCEIVNTALSREGIDVSWASYPQDREKSLVAEGTNVAFLSSTLVIGEDEKSNFVINANPLIYVSIVAFYSKDKYASGLGMSTPGDLKGKNVGVVRGTGSVSVLQKAGVAIDVANDKDLLMKKLIANRNDVAVVADLTGLYALQEFAADKAGDYKYESVYNSPIDLIFSKKSPQAAAIKAKYDSGVAKIKADGTFMRILAKYYPKGQVNKSILTKDMQ